MVPFEPIAPLPELGPIRPPSESFSLLVRVSRNCPFNRCAFCPVYKGTRFSLRGADEVCADIDAMADIAERIAERAAEVGGFERAVALDWLRRPEASLAVQVGRFLMSGGRTAFLQDANALIAPVVDLVRILEHLRRQFPTVTRVTSYARSHTLTHRSVDELTALREAGLDRIHVGLESGSDEVLALVDKGATAARHVDAGLRVKAARMELCEYVMPGLGGRALSDVHADETARVLRAIEPDFVRLRSLTIAPSTPLSDLVASGRFAPLGDLELVRELRRLLGGLDGVHTTLRSDHVLNLLEELSGRLPEALDSLLSVIDRLLSMSPEQQERFIVGRRFGALRRLDDLEEPDLAARAEQLRQRLRSRYGGPLDRAILEITSRFV